MSEKSMDSLKDYLQNKSGSESEKFADAYQRAERMKEWKERESRQKCRIYIPSKDSDNDSAQTNED